MPNLNGHCAKFLDDSDAQQLPQSAQCPLQTQEAVRHVWEVLLEVIVKGGPFAHSDKEKKLPELLDEACRLFPLGPPPESGCRWQKTEGRAVEEYSDFCRRVFLKTLECPISSRRYTVEKGSAYLYLRNAFSLTRAAIFPGFDMAYWPGDQVNEEEENPSTRHGRRKGQTKF